jgi:hypothetical protein
LIDHQQARTTDTDTIKSFASLATWLRQNEATFGVAFQMPDMRAAVNRSHYRAADCLEVGNTAVGAPRSENSAVFISVAVALGAVD